MINESNANAVANNYYGSISSSSSAKNNHNTGSAENWSTKDERDPLLLQRKNSKSNRDSTHKATTNSWWSALTFGWLSPLLQHGNQKQRLDPEDLDSIPLPEDCTTDQVVQIFEHYWHQELEQHLTKSNNANTVDNWILIRALYKAFGAEFLQAGLLKFCHDACLFVGPQVLHAMIAFLRNAEASWREGLAWTILVSVSQLIMSLCLRHYFFKCYRTGLRIRTAIVVAVYQKALKISTISGGGGGGGKTNNRGRSVGEITNFMSVDAKRLQSLTTFLHAIWYSIFQISLAIVFLWQQLGASCLGGVAVLILIMPITKQVSQRFETVEEELMRAKDARVNLNSEVLTSIKFVKLQAWEDSFCKRILQLRDKELQVLRRYWILSSASDMIYDTAPLAVALATFAVYVWMGHTLDVASALTALALFSILNFPIYMLPETINNIVSAMVSIKRVQSFLLCDEHEPLNQGTLMDVGIVMTDYSATYNDEDGSNSKENNDTSDAVEKEKAFPPVKLATSSTVAESDTSDNENSKPNPTNAENEMQSTSANPLCLKSINFQCRRGELIAVCGSVGSGKSSFINAILGEVKQVSGTSSIYGSLSYAAQTPFIFNGSLKENVVFGNDQAFNASRYQRALSVCALDHDLKLLPAGDLTEIGERGVNLSGGQKARVSLARAVYNGADIALVDDALSSVDAHVAKHIFEKCIVRELHGDNRCVILVTNAVQFLDHEKVTRIIVLKDGQICEEGRFEDLCRSKDSQFAKFRAATKKQSNIRPTESKSAETEADDLSSREDRKRSSTEDHPLPQSGIANACGELMTEEERAFGHVKLSVYFFYATAAGGYWVPFLIAGLFGLVEAIKVFMNWWLTFWSSYGDSASQFWFLAVYALINLATVMISCCAFLVTALLGLKASRSLFDDLLGTVVHAPLALFDTTPIGRIMNRFSEDIATIDDALVATIQMYLWCLMAVIGTVFVISFVSPVFTACLVPIMVFYVIEQNFFTVSYRELKRLDSVNESPIFALLGETIEGVTTIRAYAAENTLIRRLTSSLDAKQHAYYLTCSALCWLAVRLELIGTSIITFACLCAVAEHNRIAGDEIAAGLFGLAISYALSVTQDLNWSVRMASDFEAKMVAVERVKEYCHIRSEADRHTPTDIIAQQQHWPSKGRIDFKGAKLRYRPGLPLVLKGLTLSIPPRSKVGVVGRTGAGKSTLVTSLLRLVELEEGEILIDDVNIRTLGLETLRSKIAFVPQDPVLFSGTIRSNLDPFNSFDDNVMEDVLVRVGLLEAVNNRNPLESREKSHLIRSLEDPVSQGASNFSVGQRQLLVIARALLTEASIVIIDEGTAAVDPATDAHIQKVLRTDFGKATTLTVAHRLDTIKESDFILVMEEGKAAEFDTPENLLSKPGGSMYRKLLEAADSLT